MSTHPNALTQELPALPAEQPLEGFTGSVATLPGVEHEAWGDGTASLAPLAVQPDSTSALEYSPPTYSTFFSPQTREVEPKRPVLQQLYVEDPKYPGQWTEVWGDSDLDYYDESTRRAVTDPHTLAALNVTLSSATPAAPANPTVLPGMPPGLPNIPSPASGDHFAIVGVHNGGEYTVTWAGPDSNKRQHASAVRHVSDHISEVHGDVAPDVSLGGRGGRRGRAVEVDDDFQGVEAEEEPRSRDALLRPPKRGGKQGEVRIRDLISVRRVANPFVRIGAIVLLWTAVFDGTVNLLEDAGHLIEHPLHPSKAAQFSLLEPIHLIHIARGDG